MGKEFRVLLIEDVPTDAELNERELRKAGLAYTARRVETHEAFLSALAEFRPDIILSDYGLPQFSGLEALRMLREGGHDTPFILITGSLTEEVAVECMKAGANDYILKTSLKRLPSAVTNAVEKAEARRAREEAVEALRESEGHYRDLVEHTQALLCTHDLGGGILSVNSWAAKVLGYRQSDLLKKNLRDILTPEGRERFDDYFDRIRRDGFAEGLMVVQTAAGERRVWEYHNTLRTEEVDEPVVRCMAHDITERKRAEEALRESEERLRQSQKMESIGVLAGGVAHDFNNLLTAIQGNTQLVLRKLAAEDPARQRLEEVEKAAQRAATLTRQLLAFSRRQHLERRTISLNDTISDIMKMLGRIIGEDVEVDVHAAPNLSPVYADPAQVEQVVMNLAVNARDAMPQGGRLRIETRHAELDEAYCRRYPYVRPGRYVEIGVSDTGTGMDAETQRRVFEPFFTTKEVGKGTGLGLSMVYGIVKQHDGHIHVYSEPGHGTTFKVYFPVTEQAVVEEEAPAQLPLLGGTEMILVAEDEEALRALAKDVLEELGYTVLLARDGEEAVRAFEAERGRIDLLLLDVVMPRVSGREAYERICAMGGRVPAVFMTGYSVEMVQSKFVEQNRFVEECGASLIQKPYSVDSLGQKVREVLDAHGRSRSGLVLPAIDSGRLLSRS